MKYIHLIIIFAAFLLAAGCSEEDFLEREPLAEVTPEVFFQKGSDLALYTNSFYFMIPEKIYRGDDQSDNIILNAPSDRVRGVRTVPTDAGSAGWTWGDLRKMNYFLENYHKCSDKDAKQHYSGVTRFFRAYFYFDKVKMFGDVPWYSNTIEASDEEALNKARDSRQLVMDSVLADLNYAIKNLNENKQLYQVTKWTALALKSRVGLFEGTFRKYHGISGAEKFLNASWQAAEEMMNSGNYQIYNTGNPSSDYRDLFASYDAIEDEVILARQFSTDHGIDHNVNYYTLTSSYGMPGMPKDLVNSYLMKDGSRFTDRPDYNEIEFTEEMKDRDLRLSQTIRTPGYKRIGGTEILSPNLGATITGYQLIKFVTESRYDTYDESINDMPVFRYAEVLLNFAEAKAELGNLTQDDLDKSINVIRDRVALPHLSFTAANADPDPYLKSQYLNVDKGKNLGVILEIRRERRIELFMENFRWDDLMRWKEGQKLTQPFRGLYFPGEGAYDLEGGGDIDVVIYSGDPGEKQNGILYLKLGEDVVLDDSGLIDPHPTINNRNFDENKDYLYPLPQTELLLNPNLKQNPGWSE